MTCALSGLKLLMPLMSICRCKHAPYIGRHERMVNVKGSIMVLQAT